MPHPDHHRPRASPGPAELVARVAALDPGGRLRLAAAAGVSIPTVARYGRGAPITASTARRIADALLAALRGSPP